MCVKNTTYNGYHIELPNRQDEHSTKEKIPTCFNKENRRISIPLRKKFPHASIKKIAALVFPSTFVHILSIQAYCQIQKHSAYPNYDMIPNASKIRKQFLFVILGQPT